MPGFTPEGFPTLSPEFDVPTSPADGSFHGQLFDRMMNEVEVNPRLCKDEAHWLLHLAIEDPREATNLMNRLTRPGGFNGRNAV